MEQKENKMGVMPVKKLIITMSLPMMISMLVQALYNVVDSIFVAQLSEDALTAVTLAYPMQNMLIAVGSGTGVGINALLSRSLGEKRFDRSDAAANTGLLLTFCSFLLFLLVGLFIADPFIGTQTNIPEIAEMGTSYLRIVCCLSVGLFYQMTFERLLQSTGLTIFSMVSQGTGAIINIILDPIMIFGYFGMPAMGVAGAALATVIGQTCAALVGMTMNLKFNKEIHFSFAKIFHPTKEIIGEIYLVGVPSILMIAIGSVMTYAMNRILIFFSTTATAVFGVYFKMQSFFFMPVFGLNSGLIPVLAYNYGARKKDRIVQALRFAVVLAISIMTVGLVIFQIIPDKLLSMFNASDDMLAIGIPAMRTISICFPFAGGCIALGSVFQAFSKSLYSLLVSVGRQLVILIPVAWFFAHVVGQLSAVWFAFPIAEIVSLGLSVIFFIRVYKTIIANL